MDYVILNPDLKMVGSLSAQGNGVPVLADSVVTKIADAQASDTGELAKVWLDTLSLTLPSGFDETEMIDNGYHIATEVGDKWHLYTVDNVTTEIAGMNHHIQVEALNYVNYTLNHKIIRAKTWEKPPSSDDVLGYIFEGTGLILDDMEKFYVGDGSTSYEIAEGTRQQALDEALSKFELEVEGYTVIRGGRPAENRVSIVKQIGQNTGQRFEYGKNLKGASRKKLTDTMYTKLLVFGGTKDGAKGRTSIKSANKVKNPQTGVYEYSEFLIDDEANDLYNYGQPYLEGVIQNDTITEPQALLDWAKKELKYYNHPKYEYTVEVGLFGDEPPMLGDTVAVVDLLMNPPMTITARVVETKASKTAPSENNVVLGEFRTVQAVTPNLIYQLQSQALDALQQAQQNSKSSYKIEYFTPDGTDFATTTEVKRLIVRVFKDLKNVTSEFPASAFRWSKLDKDGTHMEDWERAHEGVGNIIEVDYLDANYTIRCEVVDEQGDSIMTLNESDFIFASRLEYFPEAVDDVNRRVAQYAQVDVKAYQIYWSQKYTGSQLTSAEKDPSKPESYSISRTGIDGEVLDRMIVRYGGHGTHFGLQNDPDTGSIWIYSPIHDIGTGRWYFARFKYTANLVIGFNSQYIEILGHSENYSYMRMNVDQDNGYAILTAGLADKTVYRIYKLSDFLKGNLKAQYKFYASDFGITASQTYQGTAISYPYVYTSWGKGVDNDMSMMNCIDMRTGAEVYRINFNYGANIKPTESQAEIETVSVYTDSGQRHILVGFAFASETETETAKYNMLYDAVETIREEVDQ